MKNVKNIENLENANNIKSIKKILSLLLALMLMFCMASCGDTSDDATDSDTDTPSQETEQTVDSRLDGLADNGWTLTDDGYKIIDSNEYCDTCYIASLDGDYLVLELHYEYEAGNTEIIGMYERNDEIAPGVASGWFSDVENMTGTGFEGLIYTVFVGDTNVGEGKLTEEEALQTATEYDD